jgi:hypothetical protein
MERLRGGSGTGHQLKPICSAMPRRSGRPILACGGLLIFSKTASHFSRQARQSHAWMKKFQQTLPENFSSRSRSRLKNVSGTTGL